MQKILFLDVDGVLNIMDGNIYNTCYLINGSPRPARYIEEFAVARLNYIIEQTGCSVVISSSWRADMDLLKQELDVAGFKHWDKVIGATPTGKTRGEEILAWLDTYGEEVRYCILEDEPFDLDGVDMDKVVQTNYKDALISSDMQKAIKILNEEEP